MRATTLEGAVRDYLRLTTEPVTSQYAGMVRLRAAKAIHREWCGAIGSERFDAWKVEMDRQLAQ